MPASSSAPAGDVPAIRFHQICKTYRNGTQAHADLPGWHRPPPLGQSLKGPALQSDGKPTGEQAQESQAGGHDPDRARAHAAGVPPRGHQGHQQRDPPACQPSLAMRHHLQQAVGGQGSAPQSRQGGGQSEILWKVPRQGCVGSQSGQAPDQRGRELTSFSHLLISRLRSAEEPYLA